MAFHFDARIHGRVTPPMPCNDYDGKAVSAVYTGPAGVLLDANGNRVFAPGEAIPPKPAGMKAAASVPTVKAKQKGKIAPAPAKKGGKPAAPVEPAKLADAPFTPPQPPDAPPLFDPLGEVTEPFLIEYAKQLDPKVLWARIEDGANALYGFRPADEQALVKFMVKRKLIKAEDVKVVPLR